MRGRKGSFPSHCQLLLAQLLSTQAKWSAQVPYAWNNGQVELKNLPHGWSRATPEEEERGVERTEKPMPMATSKTAKRMIYKKAWARVDDMLLRECVKRI